MCHHYFPDPQHKPGIWRREGVRDRLLHQRDTVTISQALNAVIIVHATMFLDVVGANTKKMHVDQEFSKHMSR